MSFILWNDNTDDVLDSPVIPPPGTVSIKPEYDNRIQ